MQSGNREEMFDSPSQQRSVLPLSIVLLSICFLPSSSYLSGRVTLSGLGLTSANRQGHAGRTACAASSSVRAVSFLFVTSTAHQREVPLCFISASGDENGLKSVRCGFLCVFGVCGKGQLHLTIEPSCIPQQALLCLVPRKAARAWRPEEVISCTL